MLPLPFDPAGALEPWRDIPASERATEPAGVLFAGEAERPFCNYITTESASIHQCLALIDLAVIVHLPHHRQLPLLLVDLHLRS